MKASRIAAVGVLVGAALWIGSGYLVPHESAESHAASHAGDAKPEKRFRVAVIETHVVPRSRTLSLSGRTEADRKVVTFARTNGILQELRVRRGSQVAKGDIVAILADESREAQVLQAKAQLAQRKAELEAKRRLAETNAFPRLELPALEALYKAAEASVSAAEAERDRGVIRAPFDGVVTEVSEVGTAAFSFTGKEIVQIVGLDPMLAVAEVSERKVGDLKVGDTADVKIVSGEVRQGRVRYVSKSAAAATRTYKIEVEIPNADHVIPDGITAEISIPLSPIPATKVPRSALVVSSAGEIGIRTVDDAGKVAFAATKIIEDDQQSMWLVGVPEGARVIVRGQDFVRDGNVVDAVTETPPPDKTVQR